MASTRDLFIQRRLASELGLRMRWIHPLTIVPLAVILVVLQGVVPPPELAAWVLYMVVIESLLVVLSSPRVMERWQQQANQWLRFYGAAHLAANFGWLLAGLSFFVPVDAIKALLLSASLLAISVGGLNGLSWSFRLYLAGNLLMLMPLGLWLMTAYPSDSMQIVGALCLLYVLLVSIASRREYLSHRGLIQSEFDKSRLQVSLANQRERLHQVQQAFDDLQERDRLTQLPGLQLWKRKLDARLASQSRDLPVVVVFFVDVRGFRKINQRWGQAEGDAVIADIAQRLMTFADRESLCHISADEFVLFNDFEHAELARDYAARILETLSRPLNFDNRYLALSPVIGAALYPSHARTAEQLLEYASLANYYCKRESGEGFSLYTRSLAETITRKIDIELALKEAIPHNEFHLAYQPQVRLDTGELVGMEALLRWKSKTLGEVGPAEFIPVAEQTGLILAVGEWVIRQAGRDLAEWREQFYEGFHIAINVSAIQLASDGILQQLDAVMRENGLKPGELHVEITESAIMKNATQATSIIRAIRRMGIHVALDDFGTGFSSLGYLRTLDIDYLKLDQTFIRSITQREKDREITRSVISMAKALGLRVVAEGVETEEVHRALEEQGCEMGQGWLFGKPKARSEYDQFSLARRTYPF